jgi:hypothetical protein
VEGLNLMSIQAHFKSRANGHSAWHRVHRLANRSRCHAGVRLQHGMRYWDRRPNPAHLLIFLVRRILKFHESEPLLLFDQDS